MKSSSMLNLSWWLRCSFSGILTTYPTPHSPRKFITISITASMEPLLKVDSRCADPTISCSATDETEYCSCHIYHYQWLHPRWAALLRRGGFAIRLTQSRQERLGILEDVNKMGDRWDGIVAMQMQKLEARLEASFIAEE